MGSYDFNAIKPHYDSDGVPRCDRACRQLDAGYCIMVGRHVGSVRRLPIWTGDVCEPAVHGMAARIRELESR